MRDRIIEKIREQLIDAIRMTDTEELAERIAETVIENEIGDIEEAIQEYVIRECSDIYNSYSAEEILHTEIDKEFGL